MPVKIRLTNQGVIEEYIRRDSNESPNVSFEVDVFDKNGTALGSGGATIIPDGGEISGTHIGPVVCEGVVTVTGPLEVVGDLIVRSDFVNSAGHEVTVRGDLFAQYINFNRDDSSLPQSNFSVDGDLIFTSMDFLQTGGSNATLRIGGNLIGAYGGSGTDINGYGDYEGTPGLDINVYGNLTLTNIYIGGADSLTTPGGRGGNVTVWGTANFRDLYAHGGDGTNYDGGAGGVLDVYGSLDAGYGSVYLYGGDSTGGNAGNGGELDVAGNVTVNEIEAYGGDCNSNLEYHKPGYGGNIYVDGNLTANNYINLSGGDRYGILSSPGAESPAHGGYMSVAGDLMIDGDFRGSGGSVYTSGYAPHNAGNGAQVYVYGNLTCTDDFRSYGGYADLGDGGNGGYLSVNSNAYVDDELEFYGGYAAAGNGGYGGYAYFAGQTQLGYVDFTGATGNDGNGGNGGSLSCDGLLFLDDSCYMSGGDCYSTNEEWVAGYGGDIECDGLTSSGVNIYSTGGTRYGDTSVSATGNSTADGGDLNCYGDASFYEFDAEGGSVVTTYPNAAGGAGGEVNISGRLTCGGGINVPGGSAVGNNGGAGGQIYIDGHARFGYIYTTGGSSNNSSGVGSDATTNGYGGSIYFQDGANGNTVSMLDGNGAGAAPITSVRLALQGAFHFGNVSMVDRSQCWIYSDDASGATLRVATMSGKSTLNNVTGTATGDISSTLGDSIFTANSTSTWYTITGTAT